MQHEVIMAKASKPIVDSRRGGLASSLIALPPLCHVSATQLTSILSETVPEAGRASIILFSDTLQRLLTNKPPDLSSVYRIFIGTTMALHLTRDKALTTKREMKAADVPRPLILGSSVRFVSRFPLSRNNANRCLSRLSSSTSCHRIAPSICISNDSLSCPC